MELSCLCNNPALTAASEKCLLAKCSIEDSLKTQNYTEFSCGRPVRDKHVVPLTLAITGGTLATLAFVMRMGALFTRSQGRSIGVDDFFAGLALVLAGPPTLTALQLRDAGLGKDIWTLTIPQIQDVLMYFYLGSVFYIASITAVKISIVCFILRVFPDKKFRRICYGVMTLVACYGIAFVTATALQCWPASYAWTQIDSNSKGTCNDIHLQAWLAAACNIALDLLLLVLPLHNLWMLNMGLKKKLQIMVMFSLGIFVTIISIIRLHSLIKFANSKNVTWDYAEPGYWSLVEMHVSIICACLPYCRHLLISLGARFLQSSAQRSQYASNGGGVSSSRPTNYSRKNSNADKLGGGSTTLSKNGTAFDMQTSTTSSGGSALKTPRHGDEGDFVPLVEYPHGGWDNKGGHSVTTTHAASTGSRDSV